MKKVIITVLRSCIVILIILTAYLAQGSFLQTVQAQTPSPEDQEGKPSVQATPPPAGISLQLSPTFLSLIADPGEAVQTQFRVTNNNAFSEDLRITIFKFSSGNQGLILEDLEPNDPFVEWVEFSEPEFTLAARETKTIRVTITPPESASLGYYYALAVSRSTGPDNVAGGASITGAAAIPVLLNVKSPNAKRELQIVDVKTDKFVYEYLPATIQVTVKNTGNVHVVPVGDVFIDWGGQKEIAILRINEGNGNVLPQTTRTFDTTWREGFAVIEPKIENGRPVLNDKKEPVYTTKYDFQKADKFRIGKYTANVLVVYDNGERDIPMEASVSFWIIPWKILGIALLILIFVLFGIKSLIWNPIKRMLPNGKK